MKNTQRITPKIPDGMVELLKNLAKSILKEQPDDIYIFAAEYFENLVRQRDGGALDKGYGKFRKYDLEITQLNGVDVCPRCHCTLHPLRNELNEPFDSNEPGTSPKNTDATLTTVNDDADGGSGGNDDNNDALDMSVNGVAIKALPRDGKSSSKKNRPRLDTIRSVSIDSAIDDKSQFTSPKSNDGSISEKLTDSAKLEVNADVESKSTALITTISEKTVVKGVAGAATAAALAGGAVVAAAGAAKPSDDGVEIEVPTLKTPPTEVHIEQISSSKGDEDDDDVDSSQNETTTTTATTTTSASEANTDRTVIEVGAPLNIEPNELTLQIENPDKNDSIDKSEEIITVVTKPVDEQQNINEPNELDNRSATAIAGDVNNLQLNDAKQTDRSRTPESDSGLSEKSFNLAIHESAETITNEMNNIKSEKTTTMKTTTMTTKSESTVEKIEVKSNEKEIPDTNEIKNQNQNVEELNSENERLSESPSPVSDSGPDKQNIVTESTEIRKKSFETMKIEKIEEITEMKTVEIKSAPKQETVNTMEKSDELELLGGEDLKESQSDKNDQLDDGTAVQEIVPKNEERLNDNKHPEICTTESSQTVEIKSELKDGKLVESVVKESSSSSKSITSNEQQSEQMEIVTSHSTKRASVDDEKSKATDSRPEEMLDTDSAEQHPDEVLDSKSRLIDVNLDANNSKISDEIEKNVVELNQETSKEASKEQQNDKSEVIAPIEQVSSSETQKIETEESTQHKQTESINADEQVQHTTTSIDEKSEIERQTVDSGSKQSHSEQSTSISSEKSATINEAIGKDGGNQIQGIATEVSDLIAETPNETERTDSIDIDEIDKSVLNIKDDENLQNKSIKATIDQIEKLTEQRTDASGEVIEEETRLKSSDKHETTVEELTEQVNLSHEKLQDETVTSTEIDIVEDKSDTKSSEHIDSTEPPTAIEAIEASEMLDKTIAKKQENEEHESSATNDKSSVVKKSDEDESSKSPNIIASHTVVNTVENEESKDASNVDESKEKQQDSSTIESVVEPIAANKIENEGNLTVEKLSDKSNEQNEQSWDKTTEQIAEHVQEHDGNQMKATAPVLTDDNDSSDKINVIDQEKRIEIEKNDQTGQNKENTTSPINAETPQEKDKQNYVDVGKSEHNEIVLENAITSTQNEIDEKMHASEDDHVIKDTDNDRVSDSKQVVSNDLNVTNNEPDVMDEQGKDVAKESTTLDGSVDRNEDEPTAGTEIISDSKIEGDSIQESKEPLKTIEIESKLVLSNDTPQQIIIIDPVAAVIETSITETQDKLGPIDPTGTIVTTSNNNDNEKIDAMEELSAAPTAAATDEKHEQNEQNVIENSDPDNLMKPENNSSTAAAVEDEVKENSAVEYDNNSNGINNMDSATTELSAMPSTSIATADVVAQMDSKNDESPSKHIAINENSKTKAFIENEQQNANNNVVIAAGAAVAAATAAAAIATGAVLDNNNTDDMGSESAKDEYEQAVTRSIGDESEKELLNLSLNNDFEPNQTSDSVNSEQQQQITTVEIVTEQPQQIDHDSIDSIGLKPMPMPMQPDSLDIVADSLDVSLEPSVEADSLNVDETSEDKTRSARSIDSAATAAAADDDDDKNELTAPEKPQTDQISKNDDATEVPIVRDVLIEIENQIDKDLTPIVEDKPIAMMGDIIEIETKNINDQMLKELSESSLDEKPALPNDNEGTLEISSKPTSSLVVETILNDKRDAIEEKSEVQDQNSVLTEDVQSKKVADSRQNVLDVKSDDKVTTEMHQESSKTTESIDRITDKTETNEIAKSFIDKENVKEKENDTEKVETKPAESLTSIPAATAVVAAAAAGVLGTIITTESVTKPIEESQKNQNEETMVEHERTTDDSLDIKAATPVEISKTINNNDIPSSDFSDTETDKAEKLYAESGVDETSRDECERDEVSEIENFDLSSCGEDSLEAMYFSIRKSEIIMDRHHKDASKTSKMCSEEERIGISFPEKATDDLEQAVREVSGSKKVKICSISSMHSSMDEAELKKMSSDSDELELHVIPNSEIESSSSGGDDEGGRIIISKVSRADSRSADSTASVSKNRILKDQSTVNESTDDEYIDPNSDSRQKRDDFDEVAAVAAAATVAALSFQTSQSDSQSDDQHLNETDTFNEHQTEDDMMPGNIQRKIQASSISSGGDSDGFESAGRLTEDNFNVSTAFEHMMRSDSITEESESTIESAATKIQAGARGFLARHRNRRSGGSTGTSISNGKCSSIGNAAIDKSLDNLIENKRELHEETSSTVYSESLDESSELTHRRQMLYDQTIDSVDSGKVLGITEVKVEHRKDDDDDDETDDKRVGDSEKVPDINIQGISEESATASKRRLMLQRGDAMQHNSSAEQQSQTQTQSQPQPQDDKDENSTDDKNIAQNVTTNIKTDSTTTNPSKPIRKSMRRMLGVRQRSMPVQIDTQLIRILPKHLKKRIKSANADKSSKNNNLRRPSFF